MVKTKGISATTKAWKDAQGSVPSKYKDGVARTTNWQASAIEGESNYVAGVQDAISRGARAKGIADVSDSEWKEAATKKGASRIGPGMAAAEPKYTRKMGEVISTIEGVSIAPRTQDPMSNIDNRVKPIAKALYDMKRK